MDGVMFVNIVIIVIIDRYNKIYRHNR